MSLQVCQGAQMQCTFGAAPSPIAVPIPHFVNTNKQPDANIMDFIPLVNILPFGMCSSMANPVVAAATAAKLGVFTPAACVPAPAQSWVPGAPNVNIGFSPALDNISVLMCMWGGIITFIDAGETTVNIP